MLLKLLPNTVAVAPVAVAQFTPAPVTTAAGDDDGATSRGG